jgi:hypothetical protein
MRNLDRIVNTPFANKPAWDIGHRRAFRTALAFAETFAATETGFSYLQREPVPIERFGVTWD